MNIMKLFQRTLSIFVTLGLAFSLTGCKLALLDPKGPIAASEMHLLIDAVFLMLIVVIPVILMSFWFAWRYRASNTKATYKPEDDHSVKVEIVCWTIPCIIIAILGTMTWISTHRLDPYRPLNVKGKTLVIQAISLNWKWLFIYPDQHFATVNYVNIPVNTQVQFLITSDAPMNSLEIPRLAGQIYSMAGMRTQLHLLGDTIGTYDGLSTNYSGAGFSDMKFKVRVSSQSDFDHWVAKARRAPKKLTLAEYNHLTQPTTNDPVQYFSSPMKNLFPKVIMKFMMPLPNMDIANDGTKANSK